MGDDDIDVREARRGLGLSAAELSRRCSAIDGRPARSWATTISEIESGRATCVEYPTLATIAEACGGHLWVVRTDEGVERWERRRRGG